MYITGTVYDLERRIHQLCTTDTDYDSYSAEFTGYSITDTHLYNRINKELEKKDALS